MSETTIEERVSALEKSIDVQTAVRLLTEGLSREIRELREETRQTREAAALEAKQTREEARQAREASAQENRETKSSTIGWTLGGIGIALAVAVGVILFVSERNWDMAMKAYDRGTEAIERGNQNTMRLDSIKLADRWMKEGTYFTLPQQIKGRELNGEGAPQDIVK